MASIMALCGHCGRDGRDDRITAPVKDLSRISGLGVSSIWKLLHEGQLKSVAVGRRRLVLLESYYDFIERQSAGPPLDARRNRRYNATVLPLGATRPPLDVRIADLDLSTRTLNALRNDGIDRVGDLVERTKKDLLYIPNFGKRCLGEVEAALALLHLHLRGRESAAAE
jgi:Bacterial RNA polymerase, alpha chain C terminal domain